MENKDKNKKPFENPNEQTEENISGEDILNKIEQDAEESGDTENNPQEEHDDANDLMKKFGWPKKDKLKKETAELKQKTEELNDKYLRLHAEFDNYKKRNIKERIELSKTAGIEVIVSLLPVVDDFSRAIKQMDASQDINALKDGVKLIQQKLSSILESKGLRQMKSVGEVFNPELHDAITEIPAPDESMKGKVVDEIESGYYLNDKIIRHAKVIVGK